MFCRTALQSKELILNRIPKQIIDYKSNAGYEVLMKLTCIAVPIGTLSLY